MTLLERAAALGYPRVALRPWLHVGPGEERWRKFTTFLAFGLDDAAEKAAWTAAALTKLEAAA